MSAKDRPWANLWLAIVLAAIVLAGFATPPTAAQNCTQTISLRAGWNAIHVLVRPSDNAIGHVFTNLPVESVWAYFEKRPAADFIRDANELPWNHPSWRRFIPPPNPKAVVNNLFAVDANTAYLVKATNACALTLAGRPSVRPADWVPDSYNLRGFPIDPVQPPTFAEFFAPAAAHAGQPVYRLNASGVWEVVAGFGLDGSGQTIPVAGTNLMASGEAYWVYSHGASDYVGPLGLKLEMGDGLDFAHSLGELAIQLANLAGLPLEFTISSLAGDALPLSYHDPGVPSAASWIEYPPAYSEILFEGQTRRHRLAIRRTAFQSARYEAVLRVSGLGSCHLVPLSAEKLGGVAPGMAKSTGSDHVGLWVGNTVINAVNDAHSFQMRAVTTGGDATHRAQAVLVSPGPDNDVAIDARDPGATGNGLIIHLKSDGTVTGGGAQASFDGASRNLVIDFDRGATVARTILDALNALATDGFNLQYQAQTVGGEGDTGFVAETSPTLALNGAGSEFTLRLLVHVDSHGTARLLKEVIQMWQGGEYLVNPTNGLREADPDNPGHFVLLTDEARIMDFKGGALRDGEPVGRRISCVGFDFPDQDGQPKGTRLMNGSFALNGQLTTRFTLGYDHPTNPFKHRRHPDHDNKDADFTTDKKEAMDITRTVELRFSTDPPPNVTMADYGYDVVAGIYRETLEGLHQRKLVVTGSLQLTRVCVIGELNPAGPLP